MMMPIGSCGAWLRGAFIYEAEKSRLESRAAGTSGPAARTVRRNGPRDGLGTAAGRSPLSTDDAGLGSIS